MNYGLYLGAAGALTNMHRQDVLTNNLANVTTVGFKPDAVVTRQRLPQRLIDGGFADPRLLLERLGGTPTLDPTRLDTTQGTLRPTGNDLDLALEGGGFLVVRDAGQREYLTRDGRLTLNDDGDLVTVSNGLRVLDDQDQPIRLDRDTPLEIRTNGQIVQDGTVAATIQLAEPADLDTLVKAGASLLRDASGGRIDRRAAAGTRAIQGHVEGSAVDPITTLKDLVNAAKAAQGGIKIMQYHDHLMGQAINTLGRVA